MMEGMASEQTRPTAPPPTRAQPTDEPSSASSRAWRTRLLVVGIVLAAVNLRPAITSLGALLEEVRDGLGMSGSVAGVLTSVPPLCFAAFGVMAPRLARRFGAGAVVCAGMAAIAAGLLARPYVGGTAGFLAASALALMGIAVSNVLMPVIVKRRFPDRVGSMTGLYSMALALGTAVAAAVTVPMTGALGGSWQTGLAVWAGLAAAAVLPWLPLVRDGDRDRDHAFGHGRGTLPGGARTAADPAPAPAPAPEGQQPPSGEHVPGRSRSRRSTAGRGSSGGRSYRGLPSSGLPSARPSAAPLRITRSRTAWALAVFFGLQATAAYITMGWMPQIFRDAGVPASTAGLLLAVTMAMGVPLAFVIPRVATRLPHQGPMVVALGTCGLVGYAGLYLAPAGGAWAWALLLGVANCAFPLALTMVGMRARTGAGVAQLSAFAQSTGYLISIPGPLLVGVLYQHSGGWGLPLALMTALMIPQTVVGVLAGRDRTVEDEAVR
ncbi:CynX/NimT family MFS transporter [Streptomyces achromogenes]|uniref:CynX/NimT family MFS transporter n=1 Tax=Streptomyces achromogenes TaxID=67255 RepID=UPI0027D7D693|nr:MFS transporter [Streptomyces achromogenes]